MGIRTLIVDDDFKAQDNLEILISEYCPKLEVVAKAKNLKDAVKKIKEYSPQLIFLDMELGNERGFDLFDLFDLSDIKVIVASAFEDFAIKAFQFSAIDYLLKPIKPELLQTAVQRVEYELEKKQSINKINAIIESVKAGAINEPVRNRIGIPTVFGSIFINFNEIIRCEADKNYTRIYLHQARSIMSSKNLSEIHQILPQSLFVRVHHSHVINMDHMLEYHKGKQSYIVMSDKSSVQVSQTKKADFVKRLK